MTEQNTEKAVLRHYSGPLVPRDHDMPACGDYAPTDRVWNRPDQTSCPRCVALLEASPSSRFPSVKEDGSA